MEFENTLKVSPVTATDVVVNLTGSEQTVAMQVKDAEDGEVSDAAWSLVSPVENVAVDPSSGEITISEGAEPGKVVVRVRSSAKSASGTCTVRLDPALVTTSGDNTKIYVAADTFVIQEEEFSGQELHDGTHVTYADNGKLDALEELFIATSSGTSSGNKYNYKSEGLLKFDLTGADLETKLATAYSAELVLPGNYGYQSGNSRSVAPAVKTVQAWTDGATSVPTTINSIGTASAISWDGGPADVSDKSAKLDVLSALKESSNILEDKLYLQVTGGNYLASLMSREGMKEGNRGAYIEIVQGRNFTFKTSEATTEDVTIIIKKDGTEIRRVTVKSGQSAADPLILPDGAYTYEMPLTAKYDKVDSTPFTVGESSVEETVPLSARTQVPGSVDVSGGPVLNTAIAPSGGDKTLAKYTPSLIDTEGYPITEGVTWTWAVDTESSAKAEVSTEGVVTLKDAQAAAGDSIKVNVTPSVSGTAKDELKKEITINVVSAWAARNTDTSGGSEISLSIIGGTPTEVLNISNAIVPTAGNNSFTAPTAEGTAVFMYDMLLQDGDVLGIRLDKDSSSVGSEVKFTAKDGSVTGEIVNASTGNQPQISGTYTTNKWYKVKMTVTLGADGNVSNDDKGLKVEVFNIEATGADGSEAIGSGTAHMRNTRNNQFKNIKMNTVTGSPYIANTKLYSTTAE